VGQAAKKVVIEAVILSECQWAIGRGSDRKQELVARGRRAEKT
jgi:hypothetical protein